PSPPSSPSALHDALPICFTLVHGAVAVGNLIQSDDPIEYPARLDLALEHIGKQLLNVRSYRGRPAADREIVVERRLRPGDRFVIDRKSTRLNSSHQIISY